VRRSATSGLPVECYVSIVVERGSLVNLMSNYACTVAQRGVQRLYFTCSGLGVTAILVLWAAVGTLSVIAFYLLVRAGGDASQGLLGSLMGLSIAFWTTHLAVQRYRRHGQFELDAEHGVLRRFRAGKMVGEFRLGEISRVGLVLDPTDTVRFTKLPSWLQVDLRSGEIFRLAKGTRQELEPVCEALRRLGLAPTG
jgi:hypothetical protein